MLFAKKNGHVACIAFAITLVVCKIYRVNIIRDCELSHAYIYRLLLNSWPLAANNDNSNLPRVAKRNKACGNSIYASGRRDVQLFFFPLPFSHEILCLFRYVYILQKGIISARAFNHIWTNLCEARVNARINSIRDCESSF